MAHREAACNGFVNRRAAKQQRVAQLDSDRWLRKKQDELTRPSAAKKVLLLELLLFAPGAAPSPSVEPLGWSLLGFALLLAQPGSSPLDEAPLGAQRQLEHGAPGASKDAAVARSSLASRRSFRPPLGGKLTAGRLRWQRVPGAAGRGTYAAIRARPAVWTQNVQLRLCKKVRKPNDLGWHARCTLSRRGGASRHLRRCRTIFI
jgi:hypothetical protein